MLFLDQQALDRLAGLAGNTDDSASSYWRAELHRFSVDISGAVSGLPSMGNFCRRRGWWYDTLHWLLQTPFRRIARAYPDFARCQALARRIARNQGRQYSEDMLRQALAAALLLRYLPPLADGVFAIIGDGFGVMTSLLRALWPERNVITINLTKPLLLDLASAQRARPSDSIALVENAEALRQALVRPSPGIIGLRADDAALLAGAPVALAINMESMQEMDMPVIAAYFDLLRRNPAAQTVLYCCNRREKELYDGTWIRFADFPWCQGDLILLDEPCPWTSLGYHTRPPFWKRLPTDWTLHRLAVLEKPA